MKIEQLINELQKILAVHGNIEVRCWPYDGQMKGCEVSEADLREYEDGGKEVYIE